MEFNLTAIRHTLGWLGGGILVLAAIVGMWVAFGLPRVAWSTEIERLDFSQVRLSIEFNREKSLNLFQRAVIVNERISKIEAQPVSGLGAEYLVTLKDKARLLDREVDLTDQKIIELEKYALELERK